MNSFSDFYALIEGILNLAEWRVDVLAELLADTKSSMFDLKNKRRMNI